MDKKFIISILLFLTLFSLFSCERLNPVEEGTIKFVVKDQISNEPISGAQIKITQNGILKISAKTDKNGEYEFVLPSGDYNYEVTKINYFPVTNTVKVYANEKRAEYVLLEPTENNPPNFLSYISPVDNQVVTTKDVNFEWNANDIENDIIYYNIYLKYIGNDFIKLNDSPIRESTYSYEPLIKGKYQWKIELWDTPNIDHKIMILEAPVFDYQPTSDSTINHKPTIVLKEPPDNSTLTESAVLFSWEASDQDKDPLTFDLFLGRTKNSFTNLISNYESTSYNYSLSSTGTYYWKVLASDGKETSESDIASFTYTPPITNHPPEISLISPADGATFTTNEVKFTWIATDTEDNILNYTLNIGKSETALKEVLSFEEEQHKVLSHDYKLSEPGDFYWNVVVSDKINPPVKSNIRKFTILSQNKPPVIDDYHKPDVTTVVGTSVTFEWKAYDPEGTPLTYDFYLSDVYNDVVNTVINSYTQTNLNAKKLENVELNYSSTYYWRIVARDDMYEVKGPIWSFEFIKKEEGLLPDIYFDTENISVQNGSTGNFKIKSSFSNNVYGFDIRIGYNPEFISIDSADCIPNTQFDADYHIIKKIKEGTDHNEFIFSVISQNGNFVMPEELIEITFKTENTGNTEIKFEKSTYMYNPNDIEILFSSGDPVTVTIGQ